MEFTQWQEGEGRAPLELRDRGVILVLVDTGIRAHELCDLVAKDSDNALGRLQIRHGRGDKSRVVFMGESARKALWRYLTEREDMGANTPIFVTRHGMPMDTDSLRRMIYNCADRAGVHRPTIHKFRHTLAINFLRNGGSELELQRILGHEQLETVRIYASLAESDLQAAQKKASPAGHWRL